MIAAANSLSAPQLRGHADAMLAWDRSEAAAAMADVLRAEADLADALADAPHSGTGDCTLVRAYPIIGQVSTRGGRRTAIERPWTDAHAAKALAMGLAIEWQWSADAMAGLGDGTLQYIYIGTRERGPVLQWSADGWRRLVSRGNFGRRWASGGTWSNDAALRRLRGEAVPNTYATLAEADPAMAATIDEIVGN
jgi:hypothetical protein